MPTLSRSSSLRLDRLPGIMLRGLIATAILSVCATAAWAADGRVNRHIVIVPVLRPASPIVAASPDPGEPSQAPEPESPAPSSSPAQDTAIGDPSGQAPSLAMPASTEQVESRSPPAATRTMVARPRVNSRPDPAQEGERGVKLQTSPEAPPGFETLDEPQIAVIDVHYGGEPVGRAMVEFTPEAIRFVDPDEVMRLIPDLASPADARAALAAPLPVNSDLLCRDWAVRDGCGTLQTDAFGVIFDEARLRLDLFAGQAMLVASGEGRTRYLPPPDRTASLLVSAGGAISIEESSKGSSENFSVFLQGAGAIGPVHLLGRAVQLDRGGPRLDSAWLGYDLRDWGYRAGLFDEAGLAPLPTTRLLGISAGTTFDLRANRDQTSGTPIQIFLQRRAQVDILRDGRLIGSRQVEAGNQVLDTADLPEGAYEITLRITDATGQREERRFFSKSRDLPPSDSPSFRIEAGLRQETSGVTAELPADAPFVVRGEAGFRLWESMGISAGIAVEPESLFFGAGLSWVVPGIRAGLRLLGSDRGDFGGNAFANGSLGSIHWSAAVSGLQAVQLDADARMTKVRLPRDYLQATGSLQYLGRSFSAGVRGSMREGSYGSGWEVGPYARIPVVRVADIRIELNLEAVRSDRDTRATARLGFYRFGWNSRFSQVGSLGSDWLSQDGADIDAAATVAWNGAEEAGYERRAALRAARRLSVSSLGIDGLYRGREGQLRGYAETSFGADGRQGVAGGEFFGNLTVDDVGLAIGGPETQPAAVVVEVQGAESEAEFTVLIDGSPQGVVSSSGPTPFALPPYRTYAVSIVPPADRLMDISSTAPRRVTLYPGTVVRLSWDVARIFVVVAKIVDADGKPIEHARVEGASNPAVTGEDGWIQVEVVGSGQLEIKLADGGICRVDLPSPDATAPVTILHDLTCR